MTISELVATANRDAKAAGWWEGERSIPEVLMLIVTEIAEAMEDYRSGKTLGSIDFEFRGVGQLHKPVGFPTELADAMIRIADLAGHLNIDLEYVIGKKLEFNRTRGHRHGGKRA